MCWNVLDGGQPAPKLQPHLVTGVFPTFESVALVTEDVLPQCRAGAGWSWVWSAVTQAAPSETGRERLQPPRLRRMTDGRQLTQGFGLYLNLLIPGT